MPKQFEHDVSASIAAARKALGDGQFGGGRIDHFRKGWALHIWTAGAPAHYWRRTEVSTVVSRCGLVRPALWTTPSGEQHSTLHGAGDFPYCKRCDK